MTKEIRDAIEPVLAKYEIEEPNYRVDGEEELLSDLVAAFESLQPAKGLTVEEMREIMRASIGKDKRFPSAAAFARETNYTNSYASIFLRYGTISDAVARIFGYAKKEEQLYYPIEGE